MADDVFSTLFASPQAAWTAHAAVPAIVAGYPLLEAIRTCHVQTTPGDGPATSSGYGRAPLNRLGHSRERWTDANRDIVTPANDLLYSNAWIDLRHGPVTLVLPPQTGRYFVLELLDAYTNNFHNLGTRNTPCAGGRVVLVGPDAEAADPAVLRCPTALVWLLGRVLVDGDADLDAARVFQGGFAIDGPAPQAPPASVACWQDGGEAVLDFLSNLGRALADFPPPLPRDGGSDMQRGVFDLLRGAHVRLGADGLPGDLRRSTLEGLQAAHAAAMRMIEGAARSASKAPWRFSTRLGRYGDDLMLRAATAWKGLGALSADEAIYATTDDDDQGDPLDGEHLYRIRFDDGGQVPAGAFWSISLYDADRYFAPNELGRHALGNRSPLERDADGRLTLHVSHRRPPGPLTNWLPAPADRFYLIARIYHPAPDFLDGRYRLPPVERLDFRSTCPPLVRLDDGS